MANTKLKPRASKADGCSGKAILPGSMPTSHKWSDESGELSGINDL